MGVSYNPFSLAGKSVLVTGASSGIGRATAVECSRLGARVVATGRDRERLQETLGLLEGEGHSLIRADLTDGGDVGRLADGAGALDGVVLCAGKGLTLPFPFCTRERYDDLFAINFFSPVETLRLLVRKKKINRGGSVVFVASIGGTGIFSVGSGVYGASKAALVSAMKFCAKELAAKKIRVNSVNPGMTNTKLIRRGTLTEEQLRADRERYPLKRYGEPEEIARGIVYLLSGASSWVTGHCLVIDGGISL